jgi:hypothetical protein
MKETICWWCEKRIIIESEARFHWSIKATRDHLIPKSRGGGLGVVPASVTTDVVPHCRLILRDNTFHIEKPQPAN